MKVKRSKFFWDVLLMRNGIEQGKGSGKPGFSRGGSIETDGFQGAQRRSLSPYPLKRKTLRMVGEFLCTKYFDVYPKLSTTTLSFEMPHSSITPFIASINPFVPTT